MDRTVDWSAVQARCRGTRIDTVPRTAALPAPLDRVHRYWADKADGRAMPSRADIDPVEIPRLLPHLFLVDVGGDPLRGRFRLVGGEFAALADGNLTGRTFAEVLSGCSLSAVALAHWIVAEHARPLAGRCRLVFAERTPSVDLLLLPLGGGPGRVEMVLGAVVRASWSADPADPPLEAALLA